MYMYDGYHFGGMHLNLVIRIGNSFILGFCNA